MVVSLAGDCFVNLSDLGELHRVDRGRGVHVADGQAAWRLWRPLLSFRKLVWLNRVPRRPDQIEELQGVGEVLDDARSFEKGFKRQRYGRVGTGTVVVEEAGSQETGFLAALVCGAEQRRRMIDTIRMDCELTPDVSKLMRSGFSRGTVEKVDASGEVHDRTVYTWSKKGGHPHFVQYLPEVGVVKAEMSLPKVLYGENVSMIGPGESEKVLDVVSNRISDLVGDMPAVREWNVRGRLDCVFSWDAGKQVYDYLQAFKSVGLPRHTTEMVDKEATLYWWNSTRRLRMYDKFKESQEQKAKGLLRFEVQLNHAKQELGALGIHSTRLGDIVNWGTAKKVLEEYLGRLGGDLVICDDMKLAKSLVQKVGPAKARRLMGAIVLYRMFSNSDLEALGFERHMAARDRREVARVGLSVGKADRGVLPPLQLPAVYDGMPGRLSA